MTTFGPGVFLTSAVVATTPCATEPPIVGLPRGERPGRSRVVDGDDVVVGIAPAEFGQVPVVLLLGSPQHRCHAVDEHRGLRVGDRDGEHSRQRR